MSISKSSIDLFSGLLPPPAYEAPRAAMPKGLFRYIWQATRSQQIRLCFLTVLIFPLSLAPLELQRRIVNEAIGQGDLDLLLVLAAIYLGVILVHGVLKFVRSFYIGRVIEGVTRSIRDRVVRSGRAAPAEEHGEDEEGARVAVLTVETEKLSGFVAESFAFPLLNAGIFFSTVAYMLWVEPLLAAFSLLVFLPQAVAVPIVQRRINRLAAASTRLVRRLSQIFVAAPGATIEEPGLGRFAKGLSRVYDVRMRMVFLKHLLKGFNNFLSQLGPLAILAVGGYLVIQGRSEVGTIVAFLSGFERLVDPARELLGFYRRVSQMRVQYGLVRETIGNRLQAPALHDIGSA
jgi:ABC-type bacteriocin/lantibiotic exporter with double-glycine peptidase domain